MRYGGRKSAGSPDRWFFITRRRIGDDLLLVQNRAPLSKRQLAAALEETDSGPEPSEIFSAKGAYRHAVDEALFKLGSRYDPLIDLLIQLRQPQLMRDMKEDVLSNALSEALPPVEESLITEVAESFQGLDSDRQRTEDHADMLESVVTFRDGYRQYLAVAVRRLCAVVRSGHSQFERATKELRSIEEGIAENAEQVAGSQALRLETGTRFTAFESELATLRESPEMRDKQELDRAQKLAADRQQEEKIALDDLRAAEQQLAVDISDREQRAVACDELRSSLDRASDQLRSDHQTLATRQEAFFDWREAELQATRERVEEFIATHHQSLRHLRQRNAELGSRQQRYELERESLERSREHLAEAEDTLRQSERLLATAIEAFGADVARWENALVELTSDAFPRGHDWARELGDKVEQANGGEIAFRHRLADAEQRVRADIARQLAGVDATLQTVEGELGDAEAERRTLADGRQPEPPSPLTRDPRPADRSGAPFWKYFEFRERIPDSEHAGWEAALESAGMLDAWIRPDGQWDGDAERDTFLGLNDDPELVHDHSLAAILQPAAEAPQLVTLLRRIGNHRGASRCWVSRDGQWANGPHHGRWTKDRAAYLGHRAREAARLRRIAELEQSITGLRARLATLDDARNALTERQAALSAEVDSAPSPRPAETAAIEAGTHRDTVQKRKLQALEAEQRLTDAQRERQAAIDRRDSDAADLGLADWAELESLEKFAAHLDDFEKRTIAFWPDWRRVLDASESLDRAQAHEVTAKAARERCHQRHRERRDLAASARARADTLLSTVGVGVEEIMRRIADTEGELRSLGEQITQIDKTIRETEKEGVRLEEQQRAAGEKRTGAEASRDRAVDRMGVFVSERLFEELEPESQPDRDTFSATAAVELARNFERRLKDHRDDDDHWNRLQSEIAQSFNELSDQLGRHGPVPVMHMVDESSVCVVRREFQGEARTVHELHELLTAELENRKRIFEEREREIIENHLIGEAAVAVQKRIREGEDWKRNVNAELTAVPTSSGIQLKFDWRLAEADDLQLKAVRELFLKQSATWTLAERDEIGAFLHNRIRASREQEDSRTWRDHLRHALDYRAWHRFGILRRQGSDEAWKKLTKRTFGTGSGGEKALTLTVPQFAAAAAHYHSAHRHAPRLILLDEVFVGIDADTRARLMGLLETFDLDYVMTSEREWGAFPAVSALAIYQLATRPGFNAIAVTRWVWNGKQPEIDRSADNESSTAPVFASASITSGSAS